MKIVDTVTGRISVKYLIGFTFNTISPKPSRYVEWRIDRTRDLKGQLRFVEEQILQRIFRQAFYNCEKYKIRIEIHARHHRTVENTRY